MTFYILGLTIIALWLTIPNAILYIATLGTATEDTHLAFGIICFIPWTLLGLNLTT